MDSWREISAQPIGSLNLFEGVALKTIVDAHVPAKLQQEIPNSINAADCYSADSYVKDRETLGRLIDSHVPPAEVLAGGTFEPSTMVGILNAGWDRFLSGLVEFRKRLPNGDSMTLFELHLKFNRFLSKALELSEARMAWRSAKDALNNRQNP